jgi:hypothetical protein
MIKNLIFKEYYMKKNILVLTVTAVMMITGCGSSGKDDNGISFDSTVQYKESATYDFSFYFAPSEKSISVYKESIYLNNKGKKHFDDTPDEDDTFTEKYDINGTRIVVKDGDDEINGIYQVKSDRIEILDEDNEIEETLARYVDKGDYIVATSKADEINGIPTTTQFACRVIAHFETKSFSDKEYSDLLKVECKGKEFGETKSDRLSSEYDSDFHETIYFEKGTGLVYSESIECTKLITTLNGQENVQATCEKSVTTLISHNNL